MPHLPARLGRTARRAVIVFGIAAAAVGASADQQPDPLADFRARVNQYGKLRDRVEGKIGRVPETSNAAVVTLRQKALRDAIREQRASARQGDIFTPAAAGVFRHLIEEDFEHRPHAERRALVRSVPTIAVHVNDAYPPAVPLATVPPRLPEKLPRIPDKLQYRFVGSSLILYDIDADLVVDVLPDAIPARYRKR